jgi:hypothetical protein
MQKIDQSITSQFLAAWTGEGVQILVHPMMNEALVVWAWDTPAREVEAAAGRAKTMGFTEITEVGNVEGHQVPGTDTDDCDYYRLAVKK